NAIKVLNMQHFGDETIADTLNLVRPPRAAGENIALSRLDRENLDVGILLFQVLARASNRASRSLRQHQRANFALGLLPNFRPGGAIMRLDVIGVDKLAHLPIFARGSGLEFFDLIDYQVYIAFRAGSQH